MNEQLHKGDGVLSGSIAKNLKRGVIKNYIRIYNIGIKIKKRYIKCNNNSKALKGKKSKNCLKIKIYNLLSKN